MLARDVLGDRETERARIELALMQIFGLSCYSLPNGNVGCIIQVVSAVVSGGRLRALEYDPATDTLGTAELVFNLRAR